MVNWSEQDIDVLIDMLDDPLRRWFAALELFTTLHCSRDRLMGEQFCRIAEIVASDATLDDHAVAEVLWALHLNERPPAIDTASSARVGIATQPRVRWQGECYLFESLKAAQAYLDYDDWRKRSHVQDGEPDS